MFNENINFLFNSLVPLDPYKNPLAHTPNDFGGIIGTLIRASWMSSFPRGKATPPKSEGAGSVAGTLARLLGFENSKTIHASLKGRNSYLFSAAIDSIPGSIVLDDDPAQPLAEHSN